ncbi:MAG: sensor histidine kinase [Propioniciclava sp.]|uniref:sensor histidine kinase n=1 Tax=Propioniciclava sp. TaxID=2038686 RepID=UPI0039E2FB0B
MSLDERMRAAALLERERIARELHDSLAQVLGVAHLRLHALAARPSVRADEPAHREVLDLAELCHEAYADVREAILALRESTNPDRTLLEHLRAYVATFSRTSGVPTSLVVHTGAEPCLAPCAEIQVVRIIQEALTNVRKHSGASGATVTVRALPHQVECTVADDGVGFEPADALSGDGFGLTSMRERAEAAGGGLHVDSAPGRGTRVTVRVPGRGVAASAHPAEATA